MAYMISLRRVFSNVAVAVVIAGGLVIAGCAGGSVTTPAGTSSTSTTGTTATFSSIAGAPTSLTATTQAVTLPAVPGVSNVGGTVMIGTTTGTGTAVVMVASATS